MSLDPKTTLFLLCDIQTKFRPAIHAFDSVAFSANKMLRLAKLLDIQVMVTTQNLNRMGPIDPAVDLSMLNESQITREDKTRFSMVTDNLRSSIVQWAQSRGLPAMDNVKCNIVVSGIEAHICVLQTVLDLLDMQLPTLTPQVLVPNDAVSSTSFAEQSVAMHMLRHAGAVVTTTESLAFRLIKDANNPLFKSLASLVKESKEGTRKALDLLVIGKEDTKEDNGEKSAL